MNSRKGQGLSMNVIIIAAISLLVLVILAILIANSGSNFSEGTKCIERGGTCKTAGTCTNIIPQTTEGELCKNNYVCCSPVPVN